MNGADLHETHARPVLACLGVASRFRLVRALAVADRCVGELAEAVGLSQSCTTRHLQALERVGLVKGHREGRRVRFSLRAEAPGLSGLLGWALSDGEAEVLAAGEGPLRGPTVARPPSPNTSPRTGSAEGASRHGAAAGSKATGSQLIGPADSVDGVSRMASGYRPARESNELEDYLL